jgi:hypothetical protein
MPLRRFAPACTSTVAFLVASVFAPLAHSTSCTTNAQMTAALRTSLSDTARSLIAVIQNNNMEALRSRMLPTMAGDFAGISASAQALSPLIQHAAITLDEIYLLDASTLQASNERTQFFCGAPTVVLTFDGLPQGTYALSIMHATGVSKPQQISLILAKATDGTWQLAGFYSKPMIEDGHDGLWYRKTARGYAQERKSWNAWLYYRVAASLLDPLDFLSSPNLEKLQQETQRIRPSDVPEGGPVTLSANGATFKLTVIDTTTEFGALDIDLHYAPDSSQVEQLRTPTAARRQVTDLMAALLAQHPELREAFHGIWVHAEEKDATLFALELPISGIAPGQAAQPDPAR